MSEQLSDPRETDLSAQESREPKAWWACVLEVDWMVRVRRTSLRGMLRPGR